MSKLVTIREAAKTLGLPRDAVGKLVKKGLLEVVQSGTVVRIRKDSIDTFLTTERNLAEQAIKEIFNEIMGVIDG